MNKLNKLIGEIKTYKQLIKSYEYGKLTSEITKYYNTPNKFYEHTKIYTDEGNVFENIRVCDSFYIWTYRPYLKSVTKEKYNPPLKINSNIFLKDLKEKNGIYTKINFIKEDKNHYVFEIIRWHNDTKMFPKQKSKVFYRKDIGYPDKVIFYDSEGNEETQMISAYSELNKSLDNAMFTFHVPDNVLVTELKEQKGPIRKITVGIEGKSE